MDASFKVFFDKLSTVTSPRIVELGTRRADPAVRLSMADWLAEMLPTAKHVGTDFEPGIDVDVVADAHHLSASFERGSFDAFISKSTFEHFRWPWVAVMELNKVLKLGGIGYVQTHQTFPIHGYPSDYWRFTKEALAVLFSAEVGWEVLHSHYSFPSQIVPRTELPGEWNEDGESFLNVNMAVQKTAEIDDERFRWAVGYEQRDR